MGTWHESGTSYPALSLHLLMYLETLASEYGGMWGAARAFVHEEELLAARLPKDIGQVLKKAKTDEAVGALFEEHLGTVIDPRIHGFTFREWLIELLRVLESEIDARRASAPSFH